MDQVKVYLALFKKHHFWPLTLLVLVVGLIAWRSGKSNYDALFAKNSSELNGVFSSVEGVTRKTPHPNEASITEVKRLNSVQTKDVMAAWQLLYDNQEQILTWPKEFEEIGRLKPTAPIRENLRQIVFNYFHMQFPNLFSIVDLREEAADVDPAAATPAPGQTPDPQGDGGDLPADGRRAMGSGGQRNKPVATGIVVWPKAERDKIVSFYRWPRAPGSKQIRYAQEDYWVYQALLKIISETNRGVTNPRAAAIKKIEALDIGQAVPRANDRAFPVPEGTIAVEEGDDKTKTTLKPGAIATDEELDNGRYVAPDGKPLTSSAGASKEFKLMPIRMRVIMDQRRIPDLLVACANSPLPVEVTRWQYRPSDNRSSGGGGSMKRAGGGAPRGGGMSATATATVDRGPLDGDPLLELTANDQRIEIRGLIYIFNPPDLGDLMEDAEGEVEGDETTTDGTATESPEEAPPGDDATPAAEETPAPAAAEDVPANEGETPADAEGATAPAEPEAEPAAPPEEAAEPAAEPAVEPAAPPGN